MSGRIACTALVLVMGMVVAIAFFGGSWNLPWAAYKIYLELTKPPLPPAWAFRISVDLSIDGRPVTVDRVVECKPQHRRRPDGTGRYYASWYQARYLLSQRLSDGSGVMIVAPKVCTENRVMESGYDPLVMWADNANDPVMVEAYYDVHALRGGAGRIQLSKVAVVAPSDEAPRVYSDEFVDWNGGSFRDADPKGESLLYAEAHMYEVPASKWQANDTIRRGLMQITEAGPIPLHTPLMNALDGAFPINNDWAFVDSGYYPGKSVPALDKLNQGSSFWMPNVIPLRVTKDGLQPDEAARGTLVYYRAENLRRFMTGIDTPTHVRLGGKDINGNRGAGSFIWLPKEQRLLYLGARLVRFILKPEPA